MIVKIPATGGPHAIGTFGEAGDFRPSSFLKVGSLAVEAGPGPRRTVLTVAALDRRAHAQSTRALPATDASNIARKQEEISFGKQVEARMNRATEVLFVDSSAPDLETPLQCGARRRRNPSCSTLRSFPPPADRRLR